MNKEALRKLSEKYNLAVDTSVNLHPGWYFLNKETEEHDIPLFPWRYNRKFIELRKLITANCIENICLLRFSCQDSQSRHNLESLMYREFDLCEYLGQGTIRSLHATITDHRAGNVILKLDNGILCSIEFGIQLPENAAMADRHEIVARRGVASDLPVDVQVPQSSVYTFTGNGMNAYKDVDNELFGLEEQEAEIVRSAFEYLKEPDIKIENRRQHLHLSHVIDEAFRSNKEKIKINL